MKKNYSVRRFYPSPGIQKAVWVVFSFLVAGSVWLSATQHVAAHALLVRSLPAANAALTRMPAQIDLWFSEPLEATISRAWVVDAAGNELPGGRANVDAADATHMTLQPPDLAPGIYTVVYRTLSQADGHEWLGSFPLTLLNPDGTRPAGLNDSPASAAGRATNDALPTPLEAFSRWLSLMGALLLFGAVNMGWIVAPSARPLQFQQVTTHLRKWGMLTGGAALLMGGWLQLGALQLALGGESWRTLLLGTRSGNLLLIRNGLTAAVLLWAWLTTVDHPPHGPDKTPKRRNVDMGLIVQMAIGVAILATFAMGSHASAVAGRNWAVLGDLIHFAAAAIWMGGLLLLAILLWQMRNRLTPDNAAALRQTVQRFSTTAMLAVFVLICSGLFSSVVQLPALNLLWRSAYGWLLVGKVALLLIALGAAFLNQRLVRGLHAGQWEQTSYRAFLRQVWAESAIGIGIMIVAAILVQTPIPQQTASNGPGYFEAIVPSDDLTVHLQITPNQVGDNQYFLHLYHEDNSPIGEVQLVRLSFVHQTAELGQANLELADQGGGLFAGQGAYQNRAGPWDVSIYVRRRGMDDVLANTTVEVPGGIASTDPWQNPVRAVPPGLLPTGIIAAVVLFQLFWFGRKQWV